MNEHQKKSLEALYAQREEELSRVAGMISQWAVPDAESITIVLATPRGIAVVGQGSMHKKNLAHALRKYADALELEHAKASGLIIPGGRG